MTISHYELIKEYRYVIFLMSILNSNLKKCSFSQPLTYLVRSVKKQFQKGSMDGLITSNETGYWSEDYDRLENLYLNKDKINV